MSLLQVTVTFDAYKQDKPNSTAPENNLEAGAVNVCKAGLQMFTLNAGRFDAYVLMQYFRNE